MPALVPINNDAVEYRNATCDYLESMGRELSELAFNNGLDSLAMIFEMARKEAERIRLTSDAHLDRP